MRFVALWLIFHALTGLPAAAQTPDNVYITRLFDTNLTYAPPPWVNGPEDIGNVEIYRDQAKTVNGTEIFIQEFIPKGASFDDWSQLYAISAETPLEGSVEGYRNGQFQTYKRACNAPRLDNLSGPNPDEALFILYCDRYKDRPEQGEVAACLMTLANKTLVKVYYHMRVPAFAASDLDDRTRALPFSKDAMILAIRRIDSAHLEVVE
ncbi:MAG TPA: hypothetical protein ENK83_04270 [Aliiroseovarius sp.]|nr:hypothetical protein [Aliiroseovarius sp.]